MVVTRDSIEVKGILEPGGKVERGDKRNSAQAQPPAKVTATVLSVGRNNSRRRMLGQGANIVIFGERVEQMRGSESRYLCLRSDRLTLCYYGGRRGI